MSDALEAILLYPGECMYIHRLYIEGISYCVQYTSGSI